MVFDDSSERVGANVGVVVDCKEGVDVVAFSEAVKDCVCESTLDDFETGNVEVGINEIVVV